MAELTNISFYGKTGCIRIFKQSIRAIGMPSFIQFRISSDASSLVLEPFDRISLTSFRVPQPINNEESRMEVYSKGFIYGLAKRMDWNKDCSYRVPGKVLRKQGIVLYDLSKAEIIPSDDRVQPIIR
ncbi:hypothetical protein [Pumilibacter muris]|uniref:hypothetical protein n=1 Tax=Pumilibacter muris TaxID=2941510 RepID=UPI00203D1C86|nr:hypothetical protein [Pumilibacter muris]